jgi:hypothetical protein
VSDALATLPWVEQGSIDADRSSRTVKFGINDESQFDLEALRKTLGSRYGNGLNVLENKPLQSKPVAPPVSPDAAAP